MLRPHERQSAGTVNRHMLTGRNVRRRRRRLRPSTLLGLQDTCGEGVQQQHSQSSKPGSGTTAACPLAPLLAEAAQGVCAARISRDCKKEPTKEAKPLMIMVMMRAVMMGMRMMSNDLFLRSMWERAV